MFLGEHNMGGVSSAGNARHDDLVKANDVIQHDTHPKPSCTHGNGASAYTHPERVFSMRSGKEECCYYHTGFSLQMKLDRRQGSNDEGEFNNLLPAKTTVYTTFSSCSMFCFSTNTVPHCEMETAVSGLGSRAKHDTIRYVLKADHVQKPTTAETVDHLVGPGPSPHPGPSKEVVG